MTTSTEPIEDIRKFDSDKARKFIFGDNLVARLAEAVPNRDFTGLRKTHLFEYSDYLEGTYKVKEGQGLRGKFFGRTLVHIGAESTAGEPVVTVYDRTIREEVEEIVAQLNKNGAVDYKVNFV